VDRRERRECEAPPDLLEARRIAVLLDELVEVVENLALAFRKRLHQTSFEPRSPAGAKKPQSCGHGESKQTKGESQSGIQPWTAGVV
jgi:hypothetical protein